MAGAGAAPVALAGTVSLTGPVDGGLAGPGDRDSRPRRPGRPRHRDRAREHRAAPRRRPVRAHVADAARWSAASRCRSASSRSRSIGPGFILNSSSCAPQTLAAVLEGADGGTATVTAPYQATDCAGLPFAPRLEATIGARGKTAQRRAPAAAGRDHGARRPGRRRRSPTSRCRRRSAPTWRGSRRPARRAPRPARRAPGSAPRSPPRRCSTRR